MVSGTIPTVADVLSKINADIPSEWKESNFYIVGVIAKNKYNTFYSIVNNITDFPVIIYDTTTEDVRVKVSSTTIDSFGGQPIKLLLARMRVV